MPITSSENILRVLSAFNPWWSTGSIPQHFRKGFKRFAWSEVQKYLHHPDIRRAVVLTGARRVGKTTILYQTVDDLLQKRIDPRRILFVSLDHPMLKLSNMSEILECYRQNIYGDDDVYYLFDEVQYADDWDRWIKTIYDTQGQARIVATGSASPVLAEKAAESGVGRWVVLKVPTLSFFEYCELLQAKERPVLPPDIRPTGLAGIDRREMSEVFLKLSGLQKHFHRYLLVGGFPELVLSSDDYLAQQVMRDDVVDKVLKRDIPSLFNIRNVAELEKIFIYLCLYSSNIISVDAISKELGGVSRTTVENYLRYLESANLIYRSDPVELTGKKILKSRSKIYIADAAIRNAILMKSDILADPEEMGIMAETAVFKHLASFYYKNLTRVGYYRDGQKGKEIDIVVDFPGGKILVEVKYRDDPAIAENDAIKVMADRAVASIVVTKNENDYGIQPLPGGKGLVKIPAYAFLYLLGNAEKHGHQGA